MSEAHVYSPIIKLKGFDPSPIPNHGIPDIADSVKNPNVVGTVGHEDWWNEQIHYCIHGYDTGGLHIPGRYYYFLNFEQLLTLGRGYHYPDFVDMDYQLFSIIEDAKKDHKGIISDKRRRAGISHVMAAIFSHGVRFHEAGYKAGIVAGLAEYSADFYEKFKDSNYRKPPEFRIHTLYNNQDNWQAGYEMSVGKNRDGSFNEVFALTANANENVFKGKILNDCAFEEGGEFKNIVATYGATKGCFMRGMTMVGTPYVWGTGGKMKHSAGFKEMVENCDDYDLIPVDIFGPRKLAPFYMGGWFVDDKGNRTEETCPNLKERYGHLAPEQVLGCEDVVAATDQILQIGNKLKVAKNKQPYYDHLQTFPLNRREMFLNFSGNPFDPDCLSQQAQQIAIQPYNKYKRYLLSWAKDKEGKIIEPKRVERTLAPDEYEDWQCVLMLEDAAPGYKDLDVAGIDSYDQNKSATSKSLGAMVVLRRRDLTTNKNIRRPICVVRMRPARKEIFYETCLMVATYYNLKKNVLGDFEKPAIIEYFVNNGGTKFLSERPKSFEGPKSEQQHKWWMKFTTYSKPMTIGYTQSWVQDDIEECWFAEIIRELSDYNTAVTGDDSDWDLADALMIAIARIVDMGHKKQPRHEGEQAKVSGNDWPEWEERGGRMVDVGNRPDGPAKGGWRDSGIDRPEEGADEKFSLTEF